MPIIEWKAPPPMQMGRRKSSPQRDQVKQQLRQRPYEWALYRKNAPAGSAQYLRRTFGPDYQVTVRQVNRTSGKRRVDIYIRYRPVPVRDLAR